MTPTIDGIIHAVADHRGVTVEDLRGKARGIHGRTTAIRNLALWLAREVAKGKLEEIAVEFGGRDHSSIVYGIQRHERAMRADGHVRKLTDALTLRCNRDVHIRDMIRRNLTAAEAAKEMGVCQRHARDEAKRLGLKWRDVRQEQAKERNADPLYRHHQTRGLRRLPQNMFHRMNLHLLSPKQLEEYRFLKSKHLTRVEAAQAIGRTDILRPHERYQLQREAA